MNDNNVFELRKKTLRDLEGKILAKLKTTNPHVRGLLQYAPVLLQVIRALANLSQQRHMNRMALGYCDAQLRHWMAERERVIAENAKLEENFFKLVGDTIPFINRLEAQPQEQAA